LPTSSANADHGGPATTAHLNGFEDTVGRWVPGLIDNATWFRSAPLYSVARATYYAPGVMEATAAYMGYSLEGFVDGIALMSPADLGKTAWLRHDGEWEGPFLVVDYAAQTDMYSAVMFNREVVEVGFRTAERWGMAQRNDSELGYESLNAVLSDVEVAVFAHKPVENVTCSPIDYVEWWETHMRFTDHLEGQPYLYDNIWEVPNVGTIKIGITHGRERRESIH